MAHRIGCATAVGWKAAMLVRSENLAVWQRDDYSVAWLAALAIVVLAPTGSSCLGPTNLQANVCI
jgi:hypothetical protein